MDKLLTIIVPCFNEQEVLPLFVEAVTPVRKELKEKHELNTELLFVDDGSTDKTLEILRDFHARDESIRYVSFSKNFGKEAGILAGLKNTKGDYAVLMDADLQHPPELLPLMYNTLTTPDSDSDTTGSGPYDSVAMYRDDRKKEGFFRRHFSSMFFRLMNRLSKLNIKNGATDFRLMNRPMINAILSMPETNRFSKGIFNWVGFNTKWLPFETGERPAGESKWSGGKLLSYSFDAILSFSEVPLKICSWLGIIFCLVSFFLGIFHFIKTIIFGDPVAGFPTLYLMMLLLGGIILLFLGIMGQYLARIYLEIKQRPVYIVKETEDNDPIHQKER
ncbi:MAG: glycosyltransferase family 2 protein [Lachnospiraceae bacterium]|nr:glycosyltransferase family 2 protein [Lachnospiraceae bacterium]